MSLFALLRLIYAVCLTLTCIVGFGWGGRTERAGAMIVLIASLTTMMVERPGLFDWRDGRDGLIILDVLVLIALLALALRSRRFWPLWATAFQLIAVSSHLMMFLEPHRILQAYALLQGFWAYPIMLSIMSGSLMRSISIRAQPRNIASTASTPRSTS